jgi:hypothetical protein
MRNYIELMTIAAALGGLAGCSAEKSVEDSTHDLGVAEVSLTKAPVDTACLRVTVAGSRTDTRTFPLTPGRNAVFQLKGLPVGPASVSSDAFAVACNKVIKGVDPTWYSEPAGVRLSAGHVTHVSLLMIHNGQASVGIDFADSHGPAAPGAPVASGGVTSSQRPYLVPVQPDVKIKAILTTGDSPNLKPDGVTPYRMVGLPDGLGAYDNDDGTFTLLSNHELGTATAGIARAHGGKGAFVSKWTIRKSDFAVLKGEDLMKQVSVWNATAAAYDAPAAGVAFGRFCSADLPAPSALYDSASGLGFDGRLFFDGEETGNEGRPMAHGLDGTSYEIPRLGNMSYENIVPNPGAGALTVVAALDDSTPGQVYVYVGNKTNSGSPVDRAGLTNGTLYGLVVDGVPAEDVTNGIPDGTFSLYAFGNVENMNGTTLESESNAHGVTKLQRPEDGAWDPNNPNDLYFVTTSSINTPSRLWRARFADIRHPENGGMFEALLDGSEGQKMFDNITIDQYGHVYLEEDVGNDPRLGKIWRYDIGADTLTEIAHAEPALFDAANAATFLTADEEGTGIIDASDILGPGWLLTSMQNHKATVDTELQEGGQYLAIFDPAAAGN